MAVKYYENPDTGRVFAVLHTPKALAEFRLDGETWVYLPSCPVSGRGLTGGNYRELQQAPPEVVRTPSLEDTKAQM